jgi:HD-GYP domain-containing protein (c-di-GMP phosphodiesterase class II)
MGWDECTIKGLTLAAAIHDIGKIAIPAEILSRPGRLSDAEMALVRGHVRAGYDLVSRVEFPWPVAEMILQHHERLDGSGYPQGLRGDEIGPGARVIAVADVVEAMSAHRPYRPARGLESALEYIVEGRGRLFDPEVVDVCVALFNQGRLTLDDGACSLDCSCERHLVG